MKTALALAAVLALGACAPVVRGGPPLALPPGMMETARIGTVVMSSEWLDAESDFADTFSTEVREELDMCAYGTHRLDLRVHVEDVERAGRLRTLVTGEGTGTLAATAELVDPARENMIVGRYPIVVQADAGGRLGGVLADRQMVLGEAFGRALCEEAFARNPRRPGLHNATGG